MRKTVLVGLQSCYTHFDWLQMIREQTKCIVLTLQLVFNSSRFEMRDLKRNWHRGRNFVMICTAVADKADFCERNILNMLYQMQKMKICFYFAYIVDLSIGHSLKLALYAIHETWIKQFLHYNRNAPEFIAKLLHGTLDKKCETRPITHKSEGKHYHCFTFKSNCKFRLVLPAPLSLPLKVLLLLWINSRYKP